MIYEIPLIFVLWDFPLEFLSYCNTICYIGISGEIDSPLHGRRSGGCGITSRKTLADNTNYHTCTSKRFCVRFPSPIAMSLFLQFV